MSSRTASAPVSVSRRKEVSRRNCCQPAASLQNVVELRGNAAPLLAAPDFRNLARRLHDAPLPRCSRPISEVFHTLPPSR